MRTQDQIYNLISDAMYKAMREAWESLSTAEKEAYRLNMHGLEMYVSIRKSGLEERK